MTAAEHSSPATTALPVNGYLLRAAFHTRLTLRSALVRLPCTTYATRLYRSLPHLRDRHLPTYRCLHCRLPGAAYGLTCYACHDHCSAVLLRCAVWYCYSCGSPPLPPVGSNVNGLTLLRAVRHRLDVLPFCHLRASTARLPRPRSTLPAHAHMADILFANQALCRTVTIDYVRDKGPLFTVL